MDHEFEAEVKTAVKGPPPLKPGLYLGKRSAIPGNSPWHHEYIASIPGDEGRLTPQVRRKLRRIGPNGERGLVISADVERKWHHYLPGPRFGSGTLVAGANLKKDAREVRKGTGRRLRRIRRDGLDADAVTNRLHESAMRFRPADYPSALENLRGKSANSNSFTRTILEQEGVRVRAAKDLPGSAVRYGEEQFRPRRRRRAEPAD